MDNLGISELVFIASSKAVGLTVVKELEHRGIKVRHTFDPDDSKLKRAFFKGDARVQGYDDPQLQGVGEPGRGVTHRTPGRARSNGRNLLRAHARETKHSREHALRRL